MTGPTGFAQPFPEQKGYADLFLRNFTPWPPESLSFKPTQW